MQEAPKLRGLYKKMSVSTPSLIPLINTRKKMKQTTKDKAGKMLSPGFNPKQLAEFSANVAVSLHSHPHLH